MSSFSGIWLQQHKWSKTSTVPPKRGDLDTKTCIYQGTLGKPQDRDQRQMCLSAKEHHTASKQVEGWKIALEQRVFLAPFGISRSQNDVKGDFQHVNHSAGGVTFCCSNVTRGPLCHWCLL